MCDYKIKNISLFNLNITIEAKNLIYRDWNCEIC